MIFLGGSKMKKILFVLMFCTLSAFSYARTYYGAIALNTRTGATGYAYDYYTKNSAISAARGHCRGNCIVPVVFWNTCCFYIFFHRIYNFKEINYGFISINNGKPSFYRFMHIGFPLYSKRKEVFRKHVTTCIIKYF